MRTSKLTLISLICLAVVALGYLSGRAMAEPSADPLTELQALKAAYDALKANADPSLKPLLWAGMIAVALRFVLAGLNAIWPKPKKWLAWTAIIAAVPIALLSHYAGGHGLMAALVVAGGGPGAVLFNEVLKLFTKKTEEVA